MKTFFFKQLLLLVLLGSVYQVSAQPQNESMKWVPLSYDLCFQPLHIFDIKVNTKTKSKTDQFIGVIFSSIQDRVVFLNTHNWKYNFTDKVDGSKQFKLSDFKPDNEGFRHPDLSQLGTPPFFIIDCETNALLENIQVLVYAGDYYNITKQTDLAIQNYRALAKKGDTYAMLKLALLLEKGTESDQKEAFDLFKKLSESGVVFANYHLALFYIEGKIVKKDLVKAETLLLMADIDPLAQRLFENLKRRKDDSTWNPRTEGLIVDCIWRKAFYKGVINMDDARECMNDLIMSQDVDVITQNLRYVYKEDHLKYSWYRYPNIFNNYMYNGGGNTSSFWNACEKLLKSGNCDWMWVYAPCGGMRDALGKYTLEIYNIPEAVWNALGINKDSSQKLKCAKLIEKWCDIALQTSDSILFEELYNLIQSKHEFAEWKGYWDNKSYYNWKGVVTDENVLKKINLVLRRKSFGTYK